MVWIDMYRHVEPQTLHAWARSLRWFRYCAYVSSGHMELPEQLKLRLRYEGAEAGFLALLGRLGLQPEPTQQASIAQVTTAHARSSTPCYPAWLDPGWVSLAGRQVYVSAVADSIVELTLGQEWSVWPSHVEDAQAIEAFLATLGTLDVIDPPEDSPRCLCPAHHPEVWRGV